MFYCKCPVKAALKISSTAALEKSPQLTHTNTHTLLAAASLLPELFGVKED